MPRYRLHKDHFIDGSRRRAGDVIEFGGNPGASMEPLDAEAWERFHAYQAERKRAKMAPLARFPFRVAEAKATGGAVRAPVDMKLPQDWRTRTGFALTNLAKQLGAPFGINKANATRFLEEMEAKQLAAITPPQPPEDDAQAHAGDNLNRDELHASLAGASEPTEMTDGA